MRSVLADAEEAGCGGRLTSSLTGTEPHAVERVGGLDWAALANLEQIQDERGRLRIKIQVGISLIPSTRSRCHSWNWHSACHINIETTASTLFVLPLVLVKHVLLSRLSVCDVKNKSDPCLFTCPCLALHARTRIGMSRSYLTLSPCLSGRCRRARCWREYQDCSPDSTSGLHWQASNQATLPPLHLPAQISSSATLNATVSDVASMYH